MNGENKKIIINHRMTKAKNTLHEVSQLLNFGFYNNAVHRIYYACFYCVTALLLQKDVKTKSHKGVRQMFGLHFIETGKMAKNWRRIFFRPVQQKISSDYEDFAEFQKDTVEELHANAIDFLKSVEMILMSETE